MKYERIKLLEHPVTQALISHKWKAYAMAYSTIILTLYLVFLAFLTAFATTMPSPSKEQCIPINGTIACEGTYCSYLRTISQSYWHTLYVLNYT